MSSLDNVTHYLFISLSAHIEPVTWSLSCYLTMNPTTTRVALRGASLLHNPRFNKGTAFTVKERKAFGLTDRLPFRVNTLEQQAARAYAQLQDLDGDLRKNG